MSKATPLLLAARRVMPATDRWQAFQSQLSRTTSTDSPPWTQRWRHLWRALPARASAAASHART